MSGLDLNRLEQYRGEILKAEIGSLFALWEKVVGLNKQEDMDLELENLFSIDVHILGERFYLYKDFLKNWRNKWDNLLKIYYNLSEITNSQFEKANIKSEKINNLSNPFGAIKDSKYTRGDFTKDELIKEIKKIFFILGDTKKEEYQNKIDEIYKNCIGLKIKLKKYLDNLISDDRFPNNEVSLWQQTFVTSSLFKALISNYILTSKVVESIREVKWRILGIQYDKFGLAEKGLKLASIQWYREITEKIDEEIKKLLEVEYPIGNEIYRDETGIYFIVGDNLGADENVNMTKLKNELRELENKIYEIFERETEDEFYPAIFLTKASRGLMNLSYLLENAKNNFLKAKRKKDLNLWLLRTKKGKAIGICPICQVRLIYESDKEKNNSPTICEVCDNRTHHKQVSQWIDNISGETIWLDEVKDKNNRVAYISLKFELEDWLNGNLLNTIIKIEENKSQQLIESIKENIISKKKRVDKDWLHLSFTRNEELKKVGNLNAESLFFDNILGTQWESWIKETSLNSKIDWINEKIKWEEFTSESDPAVDLLAILLLQFLLRKNPSPARLRRIWETTREFFEDIHINLDTILDIPKWRKQRICFEIENENIANKIKSTGEELEGDGLLYWAQPKGNKVRFYLISSIEDFIKKYGNKSKEILGELRKESNPENIEKLNEKLNNLFSSIEQERNFLQEFNFHSIKFRRSNDKNELFSISSSDIKAIKFISYKPFAKITDPSPKSYQVVIPAEYLEKFIDGVMERYNREFKYVHGKLPLHIGIVVSHYKRPAYVNLKALRRIRRDVKDINKLYESKCISEFCIYQKKKLSLASIEESINNTERYYSLYWNNMYEKDYNFYIKPNNNWKKWISTIDKFPQNSSVEIVSNTFDFEFMDTNTRKNDIFYDENNKYKRAIKRKSNRPYEIEKYWDKFKAFKKLITGKNYQRSRLFKIVEFIYSKLPEIEDENFGTDYSYMFAPMFYRYLDLHDINRRILFKEIFDIDVNLNSQEYLEKLREALSNTKNLYLFIDMFEFWHTMLKEV
ncbi:CRISPR-associated protein, Csx11 family [Thermovibrio ammonificans HB-1]|uniref:CRISPR-associated protein, Csx11 family n=1 Tax=Thermovibrio ammonificans (strain DSM 15698 / JCM 12110 / HB-1) TaxID=648996 RepID=E8T4Q3_THEA1|nr:CRISPR-associated protein Csx11 [Thermovibrio ammonificans]ADU96315.1 CRISPR-associated protein, Csx11 family [Thermovibrio ammonificans HB-1]